MTFAATVQQESRSAERHATELDGTLRDADRRPCDVIVHDLSADGLRLTTATALAACSVVTVGLPGLGVRSAMVVRAQGVDFGCRFLERLTPEELARALTAVVTAPIPITPAMRDTLLLDSATPPVDLFSPRLRLAAIAVAVCAGWALLLGLRTLL